MEPSERAEELIEHLFQVHGREPIQGDRLELKQEQEDGSEKALGGWCKQAIRLVLLPAITAAEREAFEAGSRAFAYEWEVSDEEIQRAYDDWRKERDDERPES